MENIVLDDQGHVQLVDFGLAKWLSPGDRTRTICGTLQYMVPEIAAEQPYDHSVDWWSLGVLLHVLITAKYPFPPAKDHYSLVYKRQIASAHGGASAMLSTLIDRVGSCHQLHMFHLFSYSPLTCNRACVKLDSASSN